ncbi:hypothetical protein COLO4_13017 [Corchorus olitorius]|uniref:Endonuclease/exonuclease/phosphatase n=1 Tax=Corchorus olitorius TaxID=93759 RepID=A0A1R3JYK5_9ROSI|nr:hypothetical protein COLO4_13017 [Corchorus olitorius]
MSDGDDQTPPRRRDLSILAYSIITNLEELLQLRYPVGPLAANSELPSLDEVYVLIQQLEILSEIYDRETIVYGESTQTICIETYSVNTATVGISSGVNHSLTTAIHSVEISLEDINHEIPNEGFIYSEEQESIQQMQYSQPFTIVIYNARRVARPSFIPSLQQTISLYNPHVLIITETRSIMGQHNVIEHCPNYEYVQSLAPFGYLGGSWVLCDARYVTARMLTITRKQISFELEHRT